MGEHWGHTDDELVDRLLVKKGGDSLEQLCSLLVLPETVRVLIRIKSAPQLFPCQSRSPTAEWLRRRVACRRNSSAQPRLWARRGASAGKSTTLSAES